MNQNTDFIPFALPSLGIEEENAVINVLKSKWLTTGRVTQEFENLFAKKTAAKHALAVNSATAGLHLALEALNLKEKSYVLTTPYTFAATSEVICYLNLHPYFVDINSHDFNINPDLIESVLAKHAKKISCMLPVHVSGNLCSMDIIMNLSLKYKIPVIEDAAHAFPLFHKNQHAGTFGDAGVFSFYSTKTITTGEGGMVITQNDRIADRIKLMRLHGIDRDVWNRYNSKNSKWYYEITAPGYKYNLTDLASSIGIEQLKKADYFHEKRKIIAGRYNTLFSEFDFIKLPSCIENHSWHLYIIQLDEKYLTIDRNSFINILFEKGIGTSVHFIPLHLMPYYRNRYKYKPEDYPEALKKYNNSISLPIYPDLDEQQVERIASAVIETGLKFFNKRR